MAPKPYVEVSTTLLSDAVYLSLIHTQKGRAALACWHFARLAHCEDVFIRGGSTERFRCGLSKLSALMSGSSVESWRAAFAEIATACEALGVPHWVREDGDDLVFADLPGA